MSKAEKAHFASLLDYLARVPAMQPSIGYGYLEGAAPSAAGRKNWWVKFGLDIRHPLAWHVVQELAYVLNEVSLTEKLPCVFMPTSPPPYLNGGPGDFLSWVIESHSPDFTPALCQQWLQGRLPNPVDDESEWNTDDEPDEGEDAATATGQANPGKP